MGYPEARQRTYGLLPMQGHPRRSVTPSRHMLSSELLLFMSLELRRGKKVRPSMLAAESRVICSQLAFPVSAVNVGVSFDRSRFTGYPANLFNSTPPSFVLRANTADDDKLRSSLQSWLAAQKSGWCWPRCRDRSAVRKSIAGLVAAEVSSSYFHASSWTICLRGVDYPSGKRK